LNVLWDNAARKKLIYAMPLNTDRPINRAMVVGCAASATRNYLKLHKPRTLNPLLVQHSCRDAKVVEVSCDADCCLSIRWRPSTRRPSVDALRVPAEMPTAISGDPRKQTHTSSGATLAPTIQSSTDMQSP
jgi:hypothetical protein